MSLVQPMVNPPKGMPVNCVALTVDHLSELGYYWMLRGGEWTVVRLIGQYANPSAFEFQFFGTDVICYASEFAHCFFFGPISHP